MLKVGIISAGSVVEKRAELYANVNHVSLTGIAMIDGTEALQNQALQVYSSLEDLLHDAEVDLVDIELPATLQKEAILQAAQAGKHIICQSPIASSIEEAKEVIALCEEAGVHLLVRNELAFSSEYKKVADLINQGAVGEVGTVRMIKDIHNAKTAEESIFVPLVQDIQWLQSLFGNVKRVYAKGLKSQDAPIDVAYISLRFDSGLITHITYHRFAEHVKERLFLEAAGGKGVISYDSTDVVPVAATYFGTESEDETRSYVADPALENIKHLLNQIQNDNIEYSIKDIVHALNCSLAVMESIEENKVIHLPDWRNEQ